MVFGIGGSSSKSSSQQQATASSFDTTDAQSFNFGQSGSASAGTSGSSQTIAFEDIFQKMFSGASATAAGIDTSALTGQANNLFSSGSNFLDQLSGGGSATRFLEDQLSGSPGIVDAQIGELGSDIGKFLSETVNPAITSGGVAAGTLGGSRGQVQQGLAGEAALKEFARGSTAIRAGERDRTTGIAQGLASQGIQGSAAGLGSLESLFGLATGANNASLSPFAALSQILGGTQTLTDSESSQIAQAFGIDLGGSTSTGRAGSESQSTGSSKSKSASFSMGF